MLQFSLRMYLYKRLRFKQAERKTHMVSIIGIFIRTEFSAVDFSYAVNIAFDFIIDVFIGF